MQCLKKLSELGQIRAQLKRGKQISQKWYFYIPQNGPKPPKLIDPRIMSITPPLPNLTHATIGAYKITARW